MDMAAGSDLEKTISVIEESFGPLKTLFNSRSSTPAAPDFHPELDQTNLLMG
mgnify:CR=1 FL=1